MASELLLNCPHIVDAILHGVSRSDLAVCLRVNRQFFDHAGRILYHTIRIDGSNIEGILLGATDNGQATPSNSGSTAGDHNQITVPHKREYNDLDDDLLQNNSHAHKKPRTQMNSDTQQSPKTQKSSETSASQAPPPITPITSITPIQTITHTTLDTPHTLVTSINSITPSDPIQPVAPSTVHKPSFKNDLLKHVQVVTLGTHTSQQCQQYWRISFPNVHTVRVSPSVCTSCAKPVCLEPLCINPMDLGNSEKPLCPLVDAGRSASKLVLRNFHATSCQDYGENYQLSSLGRVDEMIVVLPTDGRSQKVLDHIKAQSFPLATTLKVIFYGLFESSTVTWPPGPRIRQPTPLSPGQVITPTFFLSNKTRSKATKVYALECLSFDLQNVDDYLVALYDTRTAEFMEMTQTSVRKLVEDEIATRPLAAYMSFTDVPPLWPGLGETVQFKKLADYMNDGIKSRKYELNDGSPWTSAFEVTSRERSRSRAIKRSKLTGEL